ncbi:cyclic nucleotide-binding protein [Pedobacter cryoconitis]|uniref:Cyclic nucleotide-binding protein n=1 Tax=Pedobacter cryoconitis TaxID=188932 RepID=A0A127VE66_9SPHI|nr:Crp/Fnr family transcriptional regulator [Pedobacter cryoconitis]AMP99480.1 cyclic nucleotide-binding protein [Pedobacter cryoconitis]
MYQEVLDHIEKYVQLDPRQQQQFCEKLECIKLKKKEFLLEPGKLCKGNYFIVKGCVRQFLINQKLNEQIIHFGIEHWWIADQDSLLNNQPSACYIQAIEETELLLIREKERISLFKEIPPLETYFRIMMQKSFVASQRRIGFIFNLTEEERYRHFSKLYPGFVQRVPQYMLASYLGFTPQFLSRLRAKKDL